MESTFYSFHGPSWYLSVLIVFYIVAYPFVRAVKSNDNRERKIWIKVIGGGCCIAYAIQLLLCAVTRQAGWPSLYPCYVNPYFRIFGEGFAGILLCEYMDTIQKVIHKYSINRIEIIAALVLLADFLLRAIIHLYIWSAWIQILPMGLALIAFRSGSGVISRGLEKRVGQFLGDVSFELYMTHAFVYEGIPVVAGMLSVGLQKWIVYHAGTRFVITFIACIVFSWMVHQLMEIVNRRILARIQ